MLSTAPFASLASVPPDPFSRALMAVLADGVLTTALIAAPACVPLDPFSQALIAAEADDVLPTASPVAAAYPSHALMAA